MARKKYDVFNFDVRNSFTQRLKQSAASNITSTAIQSTINGDSFTESLKHQAINTIVMAGADYAANQIGNLSHGKLDIDNNGNIIYTEPQINKATQLLLHAGLGAATNTLTGNDALSGAISGVVGELTGEYLKGKGYNKEDGSEIAGLSSGIFSLLVGKMENLDSQDISNNVFAGYRVGKNASENNAFFVNKNKKAVVVIDDGDYNAYQVDNDVSREDIKENPDGYKDNNILYTDIFGIDGNNELIGKDLTLTEQLFNNEEIHNELLLLDGFDKNLSITDNAINLLMSGNLDVDTFFTLQNAVNNGADDYTLLNLVANNITVTLTTKDNVLNNKPFSMLSNLFNLSIENHQFIDPTMQSNKRIDCTGGCGNYGASRRKKSGFRYEHDGVDMLTDINDPIYAPNSGVVKISSTPDLPLVRITSKNSNSIYNTSSTLYLEPVVKNGQNVEQGQLIGHQKDISSVYKNTPTHTHIRIESKDYNFKTNKDHTNPTPLIFKNNKW